MRLAFDKGDLLIAAATLMDPNFHQAVVLLCEHNDAEGTYGLVLNRPARAPDEVLLEFPYAEDRLFCGGPVRPQVLQIVHPYGNDVAEAQEVLPGVWFGGSATVFEAGFRTGVLDPARCRFFLGYSGWDAGQLLTEFHADSWLKVRGTPQLVFDTPPDKAWSRAMRECGREQPLYAHFPDNPMWN